MPIFEYQGTDATGKTIKGTVSGASLDIAQQTLLARGLNLQSLTSAGSGVKVSNPAVQNGMNQPVAPKAGISPVPGAAGPQTGSPGVLNQQVSMPDVAVSNKFQGVPIAALEQYMRQCALLLKAGINAHEAFGDLSRRNLRAILQKVSAEVASEAIHGKNIADVFDRYPGAFSPFIRAMIRAGEQGGFLPKAMEDIADTLAGEIEIRNRIRIATLYPKLLFALALIMVVFINDFARGIVGRNIYSSPLLETGFWIIAGPLVVIGFLFFRYGVRVPELKAIYDTVVSFIPFIGTTNRMFAMAKFGQTFGALMDSAVPPAESLVLAADSMGNEYLASRIRPGAEALRQGYAIAPTLNSTGVFPSSLIQMISTGEVTGQMDEMMKRATEYFNGEAKVRANQMGIFLGIMILVGVVIWIASMILGTLGGFATDYREVVNENTK